MTSLKKIRILIGKLGLDAHYRGVQMLSMMLRDAGMEVVYTGLFQTAETIVQTALDEDVGIVGLSFLSGEHLAYTEQVIKLLKKKGLGDLPLLVGGVMPKEDVSKLEKMDVYGIFRPDTPIEEITNCIRGATKGAAANKAERP